MAGTGSETGELSEMDTPLSRDGSYFSLTSGGTSVYVTAQGSLADSVDSAGLGTRKLEDVTAQGQGQDGSKLTAGDPNESIPQRPTLSPVQRCSLGGSKSSRSSTSTLADAEGESLLSEEELAFLSPDSETGGPAVSEFKYSYLDVDPEDLTASRSGRSSSEGLAMGALDATDGEGGSGRGRGKTAAAAAAGLLEVKEDVSRICNALAESSNPDLRKQEEIENVLAAMLSAWGPETDARSLQKLRELALSEGGLLSNTLRKRAWPFLLGIPQEDVQAFETRRLPKKLEVVAEEIKNLVHMDVARVLKRFPPGLSDPQQDHLLSYLTTLICSVLEKNPGAYYYQGFHDISLTFLLVCISQSAPYLAYLCLNRMVESSLAPFMEVTMDATHDLIHVTYSIIELEDPQLFNQIVKGNKCPVAFCLPWVLTWYSHTLANDSDVFRLYDFILGCMDEVSPPCLIPMFTSAALILRSGAKIKSTVKEKDIATMHQALSLLPSEQESLEPWLTDSLKLMRKYSGEGQEEQLLIRAVQIKELQFELWNLDVDTPETNGRSRGRRRDDNNGHNNWLWSVGKFIFVRHRWVTMAIVVLGTAYLLQSRYDLSDKMKWSNFQPYVPENVKSLFNGFLNDVEFEASFGKKD